MCARANPLTLKRQRSTSSRDPPTKKSLEAFSKPVNGGMGSFSKGLEQ